MSAIKEMWIYLNTHEQEAMTRTQIYKLFEAVDREQNAAIAAAVQAETDRCARIIETFDNDGEPIGRREFAAAIRARSNGAGRE